METSCKPIFKKSSRFVWTRNPIKYVRRNLFFHREFFLLVRSKIYAKWKWNGQKNWSKFLVQFNPSLSCLILILFAPSCFFLANEIKNERVLYRFSWKIIFSFNQPNALFQFDIFSFLSMTARCSIVWNQTKNFLIFFLPFVKCLWIVFFFAFGSLSLFHIRVKLVVVTLKRERPKLTKRKRQLFSTTHTHRNEQKLLFKMQQWCASVSCITIQYFVQKKVHFV